MAANENLDAVVDRIFARWGFWCRPTMDRTQMITILAISVGLETVFGDNPEAEKRWLGQKFKELRGSARNAVMSGKLGPVLDLVNKERGL